MLDHPVAINGKAYMRGMNNWTDILLMYTPDQESWNELRCPPLSVIWFTVATLRGQLLVVGGQEKSTKEKANTILTFHERSRQWVKLFPPMPIALSLPEVVAYQNNLIVIGGYGTNDRKIAEVNILDTTSNKWITAEPLPNTNNHHRTCLIGDTLYLVRQLTKEVFRAHVPSLISGASFGVWKSVANVPFYRSSPIAIGNTLLTVGGSDNVRGGNGISSIHLYDPTKDQWTQCGDLPRKLYCCSCIELSGKLYILGGVTGSYGVRTVYTSIPSITH